MKLRRRARIIAVQALFEVDVASHEPQQVLAHRVEEEQLPPEGQTFAETLVYGALSHTAVLDAVIHMEPYARADAERLRVHGRLTGHRPRPRETGSGGAA